MKSNRQTGSAHAVIVICLVAALVFALGWIFWQNFVMKQPEPVKTDTVTAMKNDSINQDSISEETKTYKDAKYNIFFNYPTKWSATSSSKEVEGVHQSMVEVKDDHGSIIAVLNTGISGLGGAGPSMPYQTLYSKKINLSTKEQSYLGYTVLKTENGLYDLTYGIMSDYGQVTSGETAIVYYTVRSKNDKLGLISFSNDLGGQTKQFKSIDAAKQYYNSDEFQTIYKMISSIKIQ